MSKKLIKKIAVVLVPIIVIGIGFLVYRELFTFYLKNTSPKTSAVSVNSPYLKLNFNKHLEKEGNELTLDNANGQPHHINLVVDNKTLTVYLPSDLVEGNEYILKINHVAATEGKTYSGELRFTPQDIPYEKLDKAQQEEILRLQDERSESDANDPIMNHLPHSTLNYNLSLYVSDGLGSDVPAERIVLNAEILLTAADVRIDREGAIEQAKQDINSYITSLGLDPASYQIEYSITEPIL